MICYKGITFCIRECGNIGCTINKVHVDWQDVDRVGLPVSWAVFESCEEWKEIQKPDAINTPGSSDG